MKTVEISDSIKYVGVSDETLDLFESQYPVPSGVTYNSYVILDEKTAVMDTVDHRATEKWMANLKNALGGKSPDYLVVSHMEPDHSANINQLALTYPEMKIVGNAKTFVQLKQFFPSIPEDRLMTVAEGDTLSLGEHTLHFVMAPMVHWPEVMVEYESSEKVLFSADAFGTFGTDMETGDAWKEEAARYYLNIVGKYGVQVQALLKKAAALDIQTICPLHGPILKENLADYLSLYDTWSSYRPENAEKILVAYASIHGHTAAAARLFAQKLRDGGAAVTEIDLTRTDVSYAVAEAFLCGKVVLACATYDGGLFPPMEAFLAHLKAKNWQKRVAAILENGTWAPMAARLIRAHLEGMKEIRLCEKTVTIRSAMQEPDNAPMDAMAQELLHTSLS